MTQEGRRSENGGLKSPQHRPTAREAPRGFANQPRTKVLWGEVTGADTGVTRSRLLNVHRRAWGQVQRLYSGGRGGPRLRYSLCAR